METKTENAAGPSAPASGSAALASGLLEKIRSQKWTADHREGVATLEKLCALAHALGSVDELVNRFLAWPLPESVCADRCATEHGYPHRSGTHLLNADEARQMIEHLLRLPNT